MFTSVSAIVVLGYPHLEKDSKYILKKKREM